MSNHASKSAKSPARSTWASRTLLTLTCCVVSVLGITTLNGWAASGFTHVPNAFLEIFGSAIAPLPKAPPGYVAITPSTLQQDFEHGKDSYLGQKVSIYGKLLPWKSGSDDIKEDHGVSELKYKITVFIRISWMTVGSQFCLVFFPLWMIASPSGLTGVFYFHFYFFEPFVFFCVLLTVWYNVYHMHDKSSSNDPTLRQTPNCSQHSHKEGRVQPKIHPSHKSNEENIISRKESSHEFGEMVNVLIAMQTQ